MTYSVRLSKSFTRIAAGLSFAAMLLVASPPLQAGKITGFSWTTGIVSMRGSMRHRQ